jgi:RNA polymerase sigma factor (sigma-70 family)
MNRNGKSKKRFKGNRSRRLRKAKEPTNRSGPRTPMSADQQSLAVRYMGMAYTLARPLATRWPTEKEEFESSALLALVEAAQAFDPLRKVPFPTFARHRIDGALRDVQRSLMHLLLNNDSPNAPTILPLEECSEESGRVLGASPDRPIEEEIDAIDQVEHWLRKLPEPHALICREIYVNGQTQNRVSEITGCSRSRLSTHHRKGLERINESVRGELSPQGKPPARNKVKFQAKKATRLVVAALASAEEESMQF